MRGEGRKLKDDKKAFGQSERKGSKNKSFGKSNNKDKSGLRLTNDNKSKNKDKRRFQGQKDKKGLRNDKAEKKAFGRGERKGLKSEKKDKMSADMPFEEMQGDQPMLPMPVEESSVESRFQDQQLAPKSEVVISEGIDNEKPRILTEIPEVHLGSGSLLANLPIQKADNLNEIDQIPVIISEEVKSHEISEEIPIEKAPILVGKVHNGVSPYRTTFDDQTSPNPPTTKATKVTPVATSTQPLKERRRIDGFLVSNPYGK